jgi:hypothetical protein
MTESVAPNMLMCVPHQVKGAANVNHPSASRGGFCLLVQKAGHSLLQLVHKEPW